MLNENHFARQEENKSANGEKKDDEDSYEILDGSMSEERGSQKADGDDDERLKEDMKERFKQQLGQDTDSFDHLSQYDPDDKLLSSHRTKSIIESIISI